jgi:hypothetical protein
MKRGMSIFGVDAKLESICLHNHSFNMSPSIEDLALFRAKNLRASQEFLDKASPILKDVKKAKSSDDGSHFVVNPTFAISLTGTRKQYGQWSSNSEWLL